MIVMRLKGGLGNQLFQYALGRYLSHTKNTTLELDTASFHIDRLRVYRLDCFQIAATASDRLPFFATDGRLKHFNTLIQAFKGLFSKPFQIIKERAFSFDASVLNCSDQAYLDGFWQSEQYFAPIADVIRHDLRLKSPLPPALQELASQIQATNAVAVHVRRGDYVSNPTTTAYHGVCSVQWYEEAAKQMMQKVDKPTFFVFSDDYEWVRENIHFDAPTVYIPPSPDGQECNDMHVMSLCQHNIIANSSFSWWGAWLNANPNKIVIAPKQWFAAGNHDTKDLIPQSWIRL